MARIFPVLDWLQVPSVPPVGSTPTSRFLQMPLGFLVTEQSSRVTGSQVQGSQHRSLRLLSTRNFSLLWWQLTSGVPFKSPYPSCPWFAICPCWQLVIPPLSLPPQLEGLPHSLSRFQFQRFPQLAPHADSISTQVPQQLLSDLELSCQINTTSAPSCDHLGRHGEWKKHLATKILTKVANWRPTDYKRNLLGKLIDLWSNYQKQKRRYHLSFSFSPFRYSIRMRKPKLSENWEQAKLYFLYLAEERNLLPSRQRQFSLETHQ